MPIIFFPPFLTNHARLFYREYVAFHFLCIVAGKILGNLVRDVDARQLPFDVSLFFP